MMQAEPTATPGFLEIRQRIVDLATDFGGPVLLVTEMNTSSKWSLGLQVSRT